MKWLTGSSIQSAHEDYDNFSDDEDEEDKEKKSIKERLQAIQEVSQTVQNSIGWLASLGESVKKLVLILPPVANAFLLYYSVFSTFNFSVPELSWLAAILLILAILVLHFVPMRALLLIWGIIKFSRRLVRPHTVPNNEVLDLLSRVPDDEEMVISKLVLFY